MARDCWTVFVCDCGYVSMMPGRCRSHPYPLRGMGPPMKRCDVVKKDELESRDEEIARLRAQIPDKEADL